MVVTVGLGRPSLRELLERTRFLSDEIYIIILVVKFIYTDYYYFIIVVDNNN
jgi:hypothetical protein